MKHGSIRRCKIIEQPYSFCSFNNLRSVVFVSRLATPPDTVSLATFQPDIEKPAGTWNAELQHDSRQEENKNDRQSIFIFDRQTLSGS